jgi:hypothetical protein
VRLHPAPSRLFCLTEWPSGDQTRVAEPAPQGSVLTDPRLVFLGPDDQGELLEVMAIQTDNDGLMVIHAQRIRPRYIELLSEGLK